MKNGKYFARYGKLHGPFSPEEVEEFHVTGKIRDFSWVWDEGLGAWQPMDPAPTQAPRAAPAPALRAPGATGAAVPEPDAVSGSYQVLCHNRREFVSARVAYPTQTGCELHTEDKSASPVFPDSALVWLNVMEEGSRRLVNMRAKVCGVSRSPTGWRYQVRWERPPHFEADTARVR